MLKLDSIRNAARAATGGKTPDVSVDDTDLGRAMARRLGIPLKPKRKAPEVRITPNRAERRRAGHYSAGRFSHYEPSRSPQAAKYSGGTPSSKAIERVERRRAALEAAKAAHPAGKGRTA